MPRPRGVDACAKRGSCDVQEKAHCRRERKRAERGLRVPDLRARQSRLQDAPTAAHGVERALDGGDFVLGIESALSHPRDSLGKRNARRRLVRRSVEERALFLGERAGELRREEARPNGGRFRCVDERPHHRELSASVAFSLEQLEERRQGFAWDFATESHSDEPARGDEAARSFSKTTVLRQRGFRENAPEDVFENDGRIFVVNGAVHSEAFSPHGSLRRRAAFRHVGEGEDDADKRPRRRRKRLRVRKRMTKRAKNLIEERRPPPARIGCGMLVGNDVGWFDEPVKLGKHMRHAFAADGERLIGERGQCDDRVERVRREPRRDRDIVLPRDATERPLGIIEDASSGLGKQLKETPACFRREREKGSAPCFRNHA